MVHGVDRACVASVFAWGVCAFAGASWRQCDCATEGPAGILLHGHPAAGRGPGSALHRLLLVRMNMCACVHAHVCHLQRSLAVGVLIVQSPATCPHHCCTCLRVVVPFVFSVHSVATGLYGFPAAEATQIALSACANHTLDRVVFDVFTEEDLHL